MIRLAILLSFIATGVGAQVLPCWPRPEMMARLKKLGEEPMLTGLQPNGMLLEMYASPEGKWTVAITSPQGLSCMVAVGDSLQINTPPQIPAD